MRKRCVPVPAVVALLLRVPSASGERGTLPVAGTADIERDLVDRQARSGLMQWNGGVLEDFVGGAIEARGRGGISSVNPSLT
ncbi:hypothetical protein C8F04DRAFT_730018 [Mycena alexandri]|uniref:Uncharacterized protein n=1 Tax=Mycena alexandri TaxID=1745969 RepID=A0AAD6WWZ2_9AGAR|nr:hypothetical protein C8F04DRAFT_730018 [Mycena alexandri]